MAGAIQEIFDDALEDSAPLKQSDANFVKAVDRNRVLNQAKSDRFGRYVGRALSQHVRLCKQLDRDVIADKTNTRVLALERILDKEIETMDKEKAK